MPCSPIGGVGDGLVSIGAVLAHLLLTAVEGADVGVDVGDLLAVKDRLAVEHAVGPGDAGRC